MTDTTLIIICIVSLVANALLLFLLRKDNKSINKEWQERQQTMNDYFNDKYN